MICMTVDLHHIIFTDEDQALWIEIFAAHAWSSISVVFSTEAALGCQEVYPSKLHVPFLEWKWPLFLNF